MTGEENTARPKPKATPMGNGRWMLIDETTGEVLDDAQGYGYRSASGAHRAYGYKTASPKTKQRREDIRQRARTFWRKHHGLSDRIDDELLYAWKDGEELTDAQIGDMIRLEVPDLGGLTVAQLLRYR